MAVIRSRHLNADSIFNFTNALVLVVFSFLCIYPFYSSIILSFNEGYDAMNGGIYFWPRLFTLENYALSLSSNTIPRAFLVTIARTVIGTIVNTLFCAMFGFALVRRQLKLRKLYISLGLVTMYFSGGLIPLYLLIVAMGMVDSFWVYIIPNIMSFYNVILMMAFFREQPASLIESAKIDGANELQVFTKIVLPTSTPLLATIGLFNAVYHWNAWFDAYIYISSSHLKTLPLILVEMINQGLALQLLRQSGRSMVLSEMMGPTQNSIRLATMVIAIVPIMCVYPFIQKYFAKGIMLGAVKG